MQLNFRVEFGFSMLYSRRQYHAAMKWDGRLVCQSGRVLRSYLLEDQRIWVCPCVSMKRVPLEKPEWHLTTRRAVAGVAFEVEATPETCFRLETAMGTWCFSASELEEKGQIVYAVGPKYTYNKVIVNKEGYRWFAPALKPGMLSYEVGDMGLPIHEWARMPLAWLAPGASMKLDVDLPEIPNGEGEYLLHSCMMISPRAYEAEPVDIGDPELTLETICGLVGMPKGPWESQWHEEMPLQLWIDGTKAVECKQYFRDHDFFSQLLEDAWLRFRCTPGRHTLEWRNVHPSVWMLFRQITIQVSERPHGKLTLPPWGLVGEALRGRIYATHADTVVLNTPEGDRELTLQPGWNEFPICIRQAGTHFRYRCGNQEGEIGAIYDLPEEAHPILVGYDMTVVPHDRNGFMDWLLDYTDRTRLANLVVFRNFIAEPGQRSESPVSDDLLQQWGRYCREHGIAVEAATDFSSGALAEGTGDAMHSAGQHELSGTLYAADPLPDKGSADMKEASEKFIARMGKGVAAAHQGNCPAAFGEAAGAARYDFLAGADFIRAETMVPHTQHLLSQVRPASDAFGKMGWGVHIAVQHSVQPSDMSHCRRYWLSLYQAWMMGANMLYEEDSLFLYFKEERQTWHDALTSTKRQQTREFLRFAKTHPRTGKVNIPIAFLEGRYAAPFNAFLCGAEQTPDYAVWGRHGNLLPQWGHRQPEKCRQLLNVLMPGASTLPFRQQVDKRRFFFSGTPYGDFDEAPMEASADFFSRYRLLLNLGWNTMLEEDYEKLRGYVEQGGVLLTGIPQFSTHVKRDFLLDMADLALFRQGDLSQLCGIQVKGTNGTYSGQWNCRNREACPDPELIGVPSHSSEEDGPAWRADLELSPDAEVVAWDDTDGAPLVVRHPYGKGCVYTLAFWAYPGHEAFQKLSATWIELLAKEATATLPAIVTEPSREVFWTQWQDEQGTLLMMLNTDWTAPGNVKRVGVQGYGISWEQEVTEGTACFVRFLKDFAIVYDQDLHIKVLNETQVKLYGIGVVRIHIHGKTASRQLLIDFKDTTEQSLIVDEKLIRG